MSTCGKVRPSLPTTELLLQLRCFPLKSVSQSSWQVLLCTAGLDDSGARLEIFDSTSKQVLQKKRWHTMISWYWTHLSTNGLLKVMVAFQTQEPVQPWMGVLNKRARSRFVEDGCVYSNLISVLKTLLLLGTVSELGIFPLHNDSTYKVTVSMYLKFLFCY